MLTMTMRGRKLDMARLVALNANKAALNGRPRSMANMNARGDLLASGAKVLILREQLTKEYHRNNPKAVKPMALRDVRSEVMCADTPQQAVSNQRKALAALKAQTQQEVSTKSEAQDTRQ